MKLYYTPRSHFSRKVRILLDAINVQVDLIDVGNVANALSEAFGPNPLMKVPTLIDGDQIIFESDHIAQYIVRKYDPHDRFRVLTHDVYDLNARAVMNGIMATEVELILAARTGIDTQIHLRYNKMRKLISDGLAWLDARAIPFPGQPSYLTFHLVSMWDHLKLYDSVPLNYPKLNSCVTHFSSLSYVAASLPAL